MLCLPAALRLVSVGSTVLFARAFAFSSGLTSAGPFHRRNQERNLSQASESVEMESFDEKPTFASRRDVFRVSFSSAMAAAVLPLSSAQATPDAKNLDPDLPPNAASSYLQYRIPLQIAADFYIFELQSMVGSIDDWGEINQLARVNNNRGQGQPSRIEREFVNPMRILGLSFPPEIADEMREHQFKFEKAMAKLTKVTSGVRRDLPVEIDRDAVPAAKASWEDGRIALNDFFVTLNGATGLDEMKTIPSSGPAQFKEYGRSSLRYNDLMKKTKLCQNRGGPTLSNAWGKLMTTGYLQDSCGIPDLDTYFYQ